jgi:hypothetical protein
MPRPTDAGSDSRAMGTTAGLNVIVIGGKEFLLTATAGDAIHLSREARPDESARSAVPDWHLPHRRHSSGTRWPGCDHAALAQRRWAEVTLCSRPWTQMAGDEGGSAGEPGEGGFAPSCRRCLSLMDKLFPEPERDSRFGLIVQVITDTVTEHGYAEMWHVPGDQQAALRNQVRSAVRQRTGHRIQTLVHESMVVFICEPVHRLHADQRGHEAAEAINNMITGQPATPLPTPWRLSWDTWAAH